MTKTGVNLTAGQHVVRFVFDSSETDSPYGGDFDSFTISSTATPSNGKIVFASNRNGNNEIYSMNADGTAQARLTNNTNSDTDPAWSPDGAKIAFVSDRDGNNEIYAMNANGVDQLRLTSNTSNDHEPYWQTAAAAPAPTPTPTPEPTPTPALTPLPTPAPDGTIVADVVALDHAFFYNRLGAFNPAGMIYALRRDVVPIDSSQGLVPGNVRLRDGKRAGSVAKNILATISSSRES